MGRSVALDADGAPIAGRRMAGRPASLTLGPGPDRSGTLLYVAEGATDVEHEPGDVAACARSSTAAVTDGRTPRTPASPRVDAALTVRNVGGTPRGGRWLWGSGGAERRSPSAPRGPPPSGPRGRRAGVVFGTEVVVDGAELLLGLAIAALFLATAVLRPATRRAAASAPVPAREGTAMGPHVGSPYREGVGTPGAKRSP
jgi:hypothetical protein